MKNYRIVFWHNGNKRVQTIGATSRYNAKTRFYIAYPTADIISIEEVATDV